MSSSEETGSSGSSGEDFQGAHQEGFTRPKKAGQIKKGGYIVIKGKPCQVVSVTTSKTGKHGHAKAHITALDIFTAKKYEEHTPSTHAVEEPIVVKAEFLLVELTPKGGVTFMEEDGSYDDSLELDTSGEIYKKIREYLDKDSDVMVTVTKAMGERHVTSARVDSRVN